MDSLGPLCGTSQQRFGFDRPLCPACLHWMDSIFGLRDPSSLSVVASTDREYPEWSNTGHGCSHAAYGSYISLVHWDHWNTPYLWR